MKTENSEPARKFKDIVKDTPIIETPRTEFELTPSFKSSVTRGSFKTKKSKEFFEGCVLTAILMSKKLTDESGQHVKACEFLEMSEFIMQCAVTFGSTIMKDPEFPYKKYLPPARIVAVIQILLDSRSHFMKYPGINTRVMEVEWRKVRSKLKNWEIEF